MFYLEHFKSVEAVQRIQAEWERARPNTLIHSMSSQHYIMLEKKITFKPVFCLLLFSPYEMVLQLCLHTQTQPLQTSSCLEVQNPEALSCQIQVRKNIQFV